jgi:hypothetical protein
MDFYESWTGYRRKLMSSPVVGMLLGMGKPSTLSLREFLEQERGSGDLPYLIDLEDQCGTTALTWAVRNCWPSAVNCLIEYGANPSQMVDDKYGRRFLLFEAVVNGHWGRHAKNDVLQVVSRLLQEDFDFNDREFKRGRTVLHEIIYLEYASEAFELLERTAGHRIDWNARDDSEETALEKFRKHWGIGQPIGSVAIHDEGKNYHSGDAGKGTSSAPKTKRPQGKCVDGRRDPISSETWTREPEEKRKRLHQVETFLEQRSRLSTAEPTPRVDEDIIGPPTYEYTECKSNAFCKVPGAWPE